MRLFNESPDNVVIDTEVDQHGIVKSKHWKSPDGVTFSLVDDLVVYGKPSHDVLIAAIIHLFKYGEKGLKEFKDFIQEIKGSGIEVIGNINQKNSDIIKPLLSNTTFNRNKSMTLVPDLIHGRLWTDKPQVISFWNPPDTVYKFKNNIINFIRNFGDPKEFLYDIDNSVVNFNNFILKKFNSNIIDRASLHTMTPGPERQIMQMKLGMGGSFGSRSPYHPDARIRSRMSTSESFKNWLNSQEK